MSLGCIPTTLGAAKIAAAETGGPPVAFASMAFGDGAGAVVALDPARTALVHEVHRVGLSSIGRHAAYPARMVFRGVLPPEVGGFSAREIGIFDAAGDMILFGTCTAFEKPAFDAGESHDVVVEAEAEISPAANITVLIDPSLVLATLDDVDARVAAAFRRDRPFRHYRNGA